MKNHYVILNVAADSTSEEIKAAYRRAVLRHHPDRGGNPEKFCQIQEAYDILRNPAKRRDYDIQVQFNGHSLDNYIVVRKDINSRPVDVFDDLVDVLSRRFGMISQEKFEVDIILDSVEAKSGTRIEASIPFEKICDGCFGFGGTIFSDCRKCGGLGIEKSSRFIVLDITPGAQNNDKLIFRDAMFEIIGRIVVK